MNYEDFEDDLDELESAEDFLNYFNVSYDQSVVHVYRLHILQRFHDYISARAVSEDDVEAAKAAYTEALERAYNDFVSSDAQTEKVFKVFQQASGEFRVDINKALGR